MPGHDGISARTIKTLSEELVEGLFNRRHDGLAIVNRDSDALQKEERADRGDQRRHAEADGDNSVDRANQQAD
jgi:hypothetical protein